MTAIEQGKEEQIGDQACGCQKDILSLQSFELDRAADGPMDEIDTRCHRFEILKSKEGLNDERDDHEEDARSKPAGCCFADFLMMATIPQ